jgi:hypothetical protein
MTSINGKQFIPNKIYPSSPLPLNLTSPCPYLRHTESLKAMFSLLGWKKRNAISMSTDHVHNTLVALHTSIQYTHMIYSYTSVIYSQILALFCKTHFTSRPDHASKTAIFCRDAHLSKFNRINSLVRSSIIGTATRAGMRGRGGGGRV